MYALNNPLRFVDPSGYKYGPSDYEREMINGEHTYYNGEMAWKLGGNRTPFANAFEWGRTIGGWSYNWATGQYDNKFSGASMSAYDYSSLVLPSYLQHSGASTFTNITSMGFVNGRFQFTSVPAPTRLISNMQLWYNPSTSTMLQYDKTANEFYVPHTTILFSDYMQSLTSSLAASNGREDSKDYSGPLADMITWVGSLSSMYANSIGFMYRIINKHYMTLYPRFGTAFGIGGNLGDAAATIGASSNLRKNPNNPESYIDMAIAIQGWYPVIGDINAILYMGSKPQVYQIQENINRNENPLRNVYVPATGDILW